YFAVQRAAKHLNAAVGRVNGMISHEQIAPIAPTQSIQLLYPMWLLAGATFALSGAIWSIPMMLAAAAQRHYIIDACCGARPEAVRVVHELLASAPNKRIVVPQTREQKCPNDGCTARLPVDAKFCPVCGGKIDRAAP